MRRRAFCALAMAGAMLSASPFAMAGVPLRTMLRLAGFGASDVLAVDPAQLGTAVLADTCVGAANDKGPRMLFDFTPDSGKGFAPFQMQVRFRARDAAPASLKLEPAPVGKHWLIFVPDETGLQEMRAVQDKLHALKEAKAQTGKGGAMGFSMKLEGLDSHCASDPDIEHWLQIKRADGAFELWNGKLSEASR